MTNNNPYLRETNYFSGYEESFEQFLKRPERIELDQLVYHVLGKTEDGKRLLKYFKDHMLTSAVPAQISDNYDKACMYHEGYRAAFRYLVALVDSYQARKDFDAREAEIKPKKD